MSSSSYLLDTHMISFLMRGQSHAARERTSQIGRSRVLLSAICEAEILDGLERNRSERLLQSFRKFANTLERVAWDAEAALIYAALAAHLRSSGLSLTVPDAFIAAHALALRATLVTHDYALHRLKPFLVAEDWATDV